MVGVVFGEEFKVDADTYKRIAVPYFTTHCVSCHGPDKQKGAFCVDQDLGPTFDRRHVAEKWHEVLNVLNTGEMPPENKPRPSAASTSKLAEYIEAELDRAEASRRGSAIVLRRLNRAEYDNTIRDLLGFDTHPPPSERFGFPEDPPASGFDNIGDALMMSPLQMELYLEAAEWLMQRTIVAGKRPTAIDWHHEAEDGGTGDKKRIKFDGQNLLVNTGQNPIKNGKVVMHSTAWNKTFGWRPIKVPYEGWYTIRVRAGGTTPSKAEVMAGARKITEARTEGSWQSKSANHPKAHFEDGFQYHMGPPRMQVVTTGKRAPQEWATIDVTAPPNSPKTFEVRAWLDPADEVNIKIHNVYKVPSHLYNFWFRTKPEFPRPTLHLDWVEFEGPELDAWPPSYHTAILFDSPLRESDETRDRHGTDTGQTRDRHGTDHVQNARISRGTDQGRGARGTDHVQQVARVTDQRARGTDHVQKAVKYE